MLKVIGGVPDGEYKAIASGTLPNGKPVVVNSDGTVSVVAAQTPSANTPLPVTDTAGNSTTVVYDPDNQKVIMAWYDAGNSDYGTAVVGTVSGNSITFGSEVVFESADTDQLAMVYDPNANKVVIAYRDVGNSSYGTAIVGTVSGNSISFGTPTVFNSGTTTRLSQEGICFDSTNNKIVIVYMDLTNNQYATAVVGTVSGTGISFGSEVVFQNNTPQSLSASYDSLNQKVVVIMGRAEGGINRTTARLGTVSGTSISFGGTETVITNKGGTATSQYIGSGKTVVAFNDFSDSEKGKVAVLTVDGSTMSWGTVVTFDEGDVLNLSSCVSPTGEVTLVYEDEDLDNSHFGKFVVVTVSGTTPSVTDPVTFESAYTELPSAAYDINAGKAVVVYQDQGNSSFVTACVLNADVYNLTAENYIGMSGGVLEDNSRSESTGSSVVYESAELGSNSVAYDSTNNKIVITYRDAGNSGYGTAVVGTVSGTSITFGTPVVFYSASINNLSSVFDSSNGKIVTTYRNASLYPSSRVGTVSGTSISYGSEVVITASNNAAISSVYDSTNNKVVVTYAGAGGGIASTVVGTVSGTSISYGSATTTEAAYNSSMGFDTTNGKVILFLYTTSQAGNARVGTVSGTSITFGSAATVPSTVQYLAGVVHDSSANKMVIGYTKASGPATAIVGTVSGTSISFGSETEVQTSGTSVLSMGFDSLVNKVVYTYRYGPSPYNGRLRVGTVSGTSITFASEVTFESGTTSNLAIGYDSTEGTSVISYRDEGNSNFGTAVGFQAAGSYQSRGEVADGDPARVDIIGSLSTNQSGLTAGEKYYVQNDGTLSTTAGSPSVLAGTAISATKLVVKT